MWLRVVREEGVLGLPIDVVEAMAEELMAKRRADGSCGGGKSKGGDS